MRPNRIFAIALPLVLAGIFTSCDNDTENIYLNDPDKITLSGADHDIVLQADALDALVLTLYWNDNGTLTTSDPKIDAPKEVIQNTIELASDADFAHKTEIAVDKGVYEYQFLCRDLNGYLTKLEYEAGVSSPLYIRVRGNVADNMAPLYSDVLSINVTPYYIDTTVAFYLNASKEDTGRTLYSPDNNGVYHGVFGVGAWENWWLKEANGTLWGNDDVTGAPFVISNSGSAWNFWYPGISGCYYTIVDTQHKEWTALLIETLSVSGDIQGDMAYERKLNQWTMHVSGFTGTAHIKIAGAGKQYNAATGTDDATAIATAVTFGGQDLQFGSTDEITIAISGETDLILDFNNTQEWVLETGTAEAPVAGPAETLWVVGHNDGITGGWNWDSWLRLYNEDNACYGGVLDVNSLWGYKLYREKDNWDECWGMVVGGTGFEGSLEYQGSNNIAAPEAGLYVADVSISGLSYKLTKVNTVHYTGLNDDWSLTPMEATSTPGVYTATVNKSANTPWGVKILINEDWGLFFGGGSGYLRLYQDGFDGDNDLTNGPHTLTVNLCEGTYTYE